MNSDELSRSLDSEADLENYVRLSFGPNNPMKYQAVAEKRISQPVMLEVKLEVVSRNGVRFFDCNATRADARQSTNPSIVRFDVVRAKRKGDVEKDLERFYQAEVLVPSPILPHLIVFPKKTVKQMKVVKTRAHDECKAEAAPRRDVSADSVRENAEKAVNKARSVSGEAKPLLERKSSEFCASTSGGYWSSV